MIRYEFAKRLKYFRENAGLTIYQVGELVGKSGKTISAWEKGRGQPDADMLLKLCKVYNVDSIAEFYETTQNKSHNLIISDTTEIDLIKAYRAADPIARFKAARELGIDLPEPVEPIVMIAHGGKVEKIYVSDEVQEEILKILENTPQYKLKK